MMFVNQLLFNPIFLLIFNLLFSNLLFKFLDLIKTGDKRLFEVAFNVISYNLHTMVLMVIFTHIKFILNKGDHFLIEILAVLSISWSSTFNIWSIKLLLKLEKLLLRQWHLLNRHVFSSFILSIWRRWCLSSLSSLLLFLIVLSICFDNLNRLPWITLLRSFFFLNNTVICCSKLARINNIWNTELGRYRLLMRICLIQMTTWSNWVLEINICFDLVALLEFLNGWFANGSVLFHERSNHVRLIWDAFLFHLSTNNASCILVWHTDMMLLWILLDRKWWPNMLILTLSSCLVVKVLQIVW